jgi:hypothetical protein
MFKPPIIRVSPSPLISKAMKDLAGVYPILPASKSGREWWKNLEPSYPSERQIAPDKVITNMLNTFKYCPGVFDFINCGYMVRWVHDIEFYVGTDGTVSWMTPQLVPESTVRIHPKEQVSGCPFHSDEGAGEFIKIETPFMIETPKGWSILFIKPFYDYNNDWDQCPGIMDADQTPTSCHELNVFFRFNTKDRVIKFQAGDPLVQLIPFKRMNMKLEYTAEPSKKVKDQQQKDFVDRGSKFQRLDINGKTLQTHRDSSTKSFK